MEGARLLQFQLDFGGSCWGESPTAEPPSRSAAG